uniref:Uncharacterized protein n=1 Tax=viral metagenome TaxID=1070528 RepID=A0A6C0AEB9_9ZZZZ
MTKIIYFENVFNEDKILNLHKEFKWLLKQYIN